jgi:hypothetical protein
VNIADELRKLQDLHQSGGLSDEEFARAKRAVLERAEGGEPAAGAVQEQLEHLRQQNELLQLDQDWERERERYMVTGRYGRRYLPSKGMSVLGGVMITGFGILWTIFAASFPTMDHAPGVFGLFPLFGVLFVLFGIGVSVYSYNKAGEYERALARYHQRRREIQGRAGPAAERFTAG